MKVVEICAGGGGQALGLELAGFTHELAVDLDPDAVSTLRLNRPHWDVRCGDVASIRSRIWDWSAYRGIDLLAGGVPCTPFSVAGQQLGAADSRDLYSWAIDLALRMRPRALLLENVRGLAEPRFAAYRESVAHRLGGAGYWCEWRMLNASDFWVPQLRPRYVLVAMGLEEAARFRWPSPIAQRAPTVGDALWALMASRGWKGSTDWAERANTIAPTIVGGSRKHGGPDLGPVRARAAWAKLGVDGRSIADEAPGPDEPADHVPRLTTEMVERIQGFNPAWGWTFTGRKTTRYRQIGNAFPPPVAKAVGMAIKEALL